MLPLPSWYELIKIIELLNFIFPNQIEIFHILFPIINPTSNIGVGATSMNSTFVVTFITTKQ